METILGLSMTVILANIIEPKFLDEKLASIFQKFIEQKHLDLWVCGYNFNFMC